ncbi:hypothetical protein [Haloplasma contractile]|uniref:Uncharacterized protein n=1 Tax=Haloplasma contractile SSD-17B TaxID=1033810 RepID=U2FG86_9MOLU|nr:hypothetical protein [Haloplasma contractile]ERJ11900.1 hypothetical protein HLPCO_002140 [Haloplasma contractile SSD-17B]
MNIDILLLFTVGMGLLYGLFTVYFMIYVRHKERKLLINETIFKLPYTRAVFKIVHVLALIVLTIGIYMAYNYALTNYTIYKRLGPMNDGNTLYGRN